MIDLPPIHFLENEFDRLIEFIDKEYSAYRILLLTDKNTEVSCLPKILDLIQAKDVVSISVEAGEGSKTFPVVESIIRQMIEANLGRKTLLMSVGGGMVGDLGGFVASIYKRGIPFVLLPTSLLAMVDASVGGKTGINVDLLKNQIGTFTLPAAVFCFRSFLETLPRREIWAGKAEMLKHVLISENNPKASISRLVNEISLADIERSVRVKEQVVRQDFNETGLRKVLNFGHTIGHAIESWSHLEGNHTILHGEAVAWGILVELQLSVKYGLSPNLVGELTNFVGSYFEKPDVVLSDLDTLLEFMSADKKNVGGQIGFVLLSDSGKPSIDKFVKEQEIRDALIKCFQL